MSDIINQLSHMPTSAIAAYLSHLSPVLNLSSSPAAVNISTPWYMRYTSATIASSQSV